MFISITRRIIITMIMMILVLLLFIRRAVSLSLLPSHDSFPSSSSSTSLSLSSSYQYARNVRIQYGHEIAQPLYYNLLVNTNTKNHNTITNNTKNIHTNRIIDYTVSSRIAAASFVKNGGVLHTMKYACCYHHHHHHRDGDGCSDSDDDDDDDDDDTIIRNIYQTKIRQLNLFLQSIRYNTKTIHQFIFGTTNNSTSNSCSSYSSCSPSYLQPAIAGSVTQLPFSFGVSSSSSLSVSTTTPAPPKQQQPTSTTIDSNSSSSSSVVVVNEEDDASTFALQIFISLYLLGIAIPIDTCNQYISDDIIQLLYDLHLLCPCDIDRSLLIPTVMITPIDIPPMISIPNNKTTTTTITSNNNSTSSTPSNSNSNTSTTTSTSKSTATTAWFVTDWHPRVLNTIKIIDPTSTTNTNTTSTTHDTMNDDGRENENEDDDDEAVMYVGPDTLAMIQHWIFFFRNTTTTTTSNNNMNTNTVLLDFCTGCGVQAIMNLLMYQQQQQQQQQSKLNYNCTIHTTNDNNNTTTTAAAVCIDKNHRALRFTYFNTLLNNICDDNIILVHGDILQKTGHIVFSKNNNTNNNHFIKNLFAIDKTSSKATTSTTTITKPIVSSLLPLLQGIVATLKNKKKNDTTSGKTATSGTTSSSNKYYYDEITANPPFLPVPTTADTKQNSLSSSSSSSSFIISCDDDNFDNKNDHDTCNNYGTNDYDKTIQQMIQRRYGLFSASGNTGEEVLAIILELSRTLLKQNGFVSIVSEFFFRYNNDSSRNIDNNPATIQLFDKKNNMIMNNTNIFIMKQATNDLLERLYSYYSGELDSSVTIATSSSSTKNSNSNNSKIDNWSRRRSVVSRIRTSNSCGLLFTNQYPISSSLYAERRADNYAEYQLWLRHLQKQNIIACSPGLLYIQKEEDEEQCQSSSTKTTKQSSLLWENILVPKTDQGSVWTPTNQKAVAFTQSTSRAFFQQQQQQQQ